MDNGVTNKYIDSILFKHCKHFCGTFSSDNIPNNLKNVDNFSIVCNLANEREAGTHFVCIISKSDYVLYIDTFGLPCYVNSIREFLHALGKPIFFNDKAVQAVYSNFCGFFCILFVLHFDESKHGRRKIIFSQNLFENDAVCIREIKNILSCFYS
jgi:hypothetical protein